MADNGPSLRWIEQINQLYLWAYGSLVAADRLKTSFDARQQHPIGTAGEHHLAVTFDQESFVRALDHLMEAYRRLPSASKEAATPPPPGTSDVVSLLRDAYEHWYKERGPKPGGKRERLAALHPDSEPWSLQWSIDTGLTIAGALKVEPVLAWVRTVKTFAEAEARQIFPHAWPQA